MKPETKFWKQVKKNLPNIYWQRFENWATPGVPDCHGIKDGIEVWVELKVIHSKKINLSPFQKSWHFTHSLHGGRSFIMGTPNDGIGISDNDANLVTDLVTEFGYRFGY